MNYKILIGVISTDYVRANTLATVVSIIKRFPNSDILIKQGCYLHLNREGIAQHALDKGYEYLFFVDADMCFSALVLERFIQDNKDVVGAHYNCRKFPLVSTVKIENEKEELVATSQAFPKELTKVHALGTGCLLIKVEVFKKIKKPWFWYGIHNDPKTWCGEDVYFCRMCKRAGIDVWLDPTVQVNHEGTFLY